MANPAADIRAEIQARHPGAAVHSRGRKWIKHSHPTQPGRHIVTATIGPLHIAGTETEIATDWQSSPDPAFDWAVTQADFNVYARSLFNAGDLFRYTDPQSGEWAQFDPQSLNWIDQDTSRQQIAIKQAVTAQVAGDVIEYPNAWGSGRHFRYTAQTERLQKIIQIDSAGDLPAATVNGPEIWLESEFSLSVSAGLEIYLDGQIWQRINGQRVQTANRVEFRDAATGQAVLFYLELPTAKDSDGGQVIGQMEFRRQGGPSSLFVTVRIPKAWIDAATFPIYLDPSVNPQVGASTDDATSNDYTSSSATDTTSVNPRLNSSTPLNAWRWSAVSVPNGATINDAYFELYGDHPSLTDFDGLLDLEAADDPATFTAGANGDLTDNSRTFTGNSVTGDMTISSSAYTSSPSFVSAAQAVVNRAGWASGQAMVLRADFNSGAGNAQWKSYDDTTTLAAKLFIDYTEAGGGSVYPQAWARQPRLYAMQAILRR